MRSKVPRVKPMMAMKVWMVSGSWCKKLTSSVMAWSGTGPNMFYNIFIFYNAYLEGAVDELSKALHWKKIKKNTVQQFTTLNYL